MVAGDDLREARAVAYVKKNERAHVPNTVDPPQQHDVRADVLWPQRSAGMCASEIAELINHAGPWFLKPDEEPCPQP